MAKVYFLRHQARGVIPELAFSQPPSDEQVATVSRLLAATHGTHHPKTDEPYWLRIVEVELRGPDFKIPLPEPRGVSSSDANLPAPGVDGRGHVENPKSA